MNPTNSPPAMAELTVKEVMKDEVEADRASEAVLLLHQLTKEMGPNSRHVAWLLPERAGVEHCDVDASAASEGLLSHAECLTGWDRRTFGL